MIRKNEGQHRFVIDSSVIVGVGEVLDSLVIHANKITEMYDQIEKIQSARVQRQRVEHE